MRFTVSTYNVLATAYAFPDRYPRTPAGWLAPAVRVPALVEQIARLGSDLLCLQEVEADTYAALERRLSPLGYRGEWTQKGREKPDGCALFCRTAAFRWVYFAALYYQDGTAEQPVSGHIAQIAVLESGRVRVVVANTHLKWDEARAAEERRRYAPRQVQQLLERLAPLSLPTGETILAGDLNATARSDVLRTLNDAGFRAAQQTPGPAPATANISGRARRIDHILYRGAALQPDPLPVPAFTTETPMPGPGHPSDHVPLSVRFRPAVP